MTRAEHRRALELAEKLLSLAQPEDPIQMMGAHRAMGTSLALYGGVSPSPDPL